MFQSSLPQNTPDIRKALGGPSEFFIQRTWKRNDNRHFKGNIELTSTLSFKWKVIYEVPQGDFRYPMQFHKNSELERT